MRSPLSLALLLGAASAVALGQTPPSRADANYVRVDMYATQDGKTVDDLEPDEVDLLEDGVPQKVEAFEHARGWPRVLVVFIDVYHLTAESSANVRLPLVRLLDLALGPDDVVALMTPAMSARDIVFGRKATAISAVMQEESWGRGVAGRDPKEKLYAACFPDAGDSAGIAAEMTERRREQLTLDGLDDLVVHLRGLRQERKAILAVSDGWRLFTENRNLARVTAPERDSGRSRFGLGRRRTAPPQNRPSGVDLSECEADRRALSLMNNGRRVKDVADSANRANATFYPIHGRGLAEARADSLRELAESTDGLAIVATDLEAGLQRVVADLSSYYLLGYHSTNAKLDGRFRSLTVRVRRPGVRVRARRGYRGVTAEELLGESEGREAAGAGSGVVVDARAPFRIRASSWNPVAGGDAEGAVWIVGELDAAIRKQLTWSAGAQAEVAIVAASGTEVATAVVAVPATEGSFSLRVPSEGRLPAGEYGVRVLVRPHADAALPVSTVARLVVSDRPSALGEPMMWRNGPTTGQRHLVTADPRFRRNERIRLEMATTVDGTAAARMLDRAGNPMRVPVQVAERPDASGAFRWIVVDATLAPLAAGDYSIEVMLGDDRQVGVFKLVP